MLRSTLTLKVHLDRCTLSVSVCICLSLRVSLCFFVSLLVSVCVCLSLFSIFVSQTSILNRLINCINASNFSTNKYFEHVVMYVSSTTIKGLRRSFVYVSLSHTNTLLHNSTSVGNFHNLVFCIFLINQVGLCVFATTIMYTQISRTSPHTQIWLRLMFRVQKC